MNKQEILETITPLFKKVFNDEDIEVTMNLTSAEIDEWSSLSHAILLTEIENAFNVKFKLREVASMNNVKDIVANIEYKINSSSI